MDSQTQDSTAKLLTDSKSIFALKVMHLIQEHKSTDFSGIGVMFYTSLGCINMTDLGRSVSEDTKLPVSEAKEISIKLIQVSRFSSPWHDGFHCVNVQSKKLTHLSQFVSPPLDLVNKFPVASRPTGARQMTALLMSSINGITGVGLLDSQNTIKYYAKGKLAFQE